MFLAMVAALSRNHSVSAPLRTGGASPSGRRREDADGRPGRTHADGTSAIPDTMLRPQIEHKQKIVNSAGTPTSARDRNRPGGVRDAAGSAVPGSGQLA